MQVRHILQDKGRSIIAIGDNSTMADAARMLTQHRIGAVLVKQTSGELAGILSERDVVRAIAADGAKALERGIEGYMTRDVVTCRESDSVEGLMEVMTRGRFRHLPVLDDHHHLVGLISIGDVVKSRIAETVNEANSLRDYITAVG